MGLTKVTVNISGLVKSQTPYVVAQILFGPENVEPILGLVALENTGIGVDPRTKKLLKMTAKALK